MLNGLDLFSGIGGLTLALAPWVRPVAYCENDRFAQSVLMSRMRDGTLPLAAIWDDVATLRSGNICTAETGVDIIFGGFPCQDISVAGNGAGLGGERSSLFFEIARLAGELRPTFVFLENVPAITTRGLPDVCLAFTALGYDCRWTVVSAAEIGAVHIRERWFLLAHADGVRLREECGAQVGRDNSERKGPTLTYGSGQTGRNSESSARQIKPRVDRTGDGLPYCVDRAHALGNAVVPIQAREAFKRLMGL